MSVYFNGIAAPLIYVSENQINAVAPFGIAGQTQTSVQIINQGIILPAVSVPTAESAAGIFTLDSSGAGQAAAINQDGSLNDYAHPAKRGSIVSIFLTGAGAMQPSVVDGSVGNSKTSPVRAFTGDLLAFSLETTYVGDAPELVEGLVQVNFRIPANLYETGYIQLNAGFGKFDPNAVRPPLVYLTVN